jgi:hypothetical protein
MQIKLAEASAGLVFSFSFMICVSIEKIANGSTSNRCDSIGFPVQLQMPEVP